MNFTQEIMSLLSSRNFLIYVVTEEEERLEYTLNLISQKFFKENICIWDFLEGYKKNPNINHKAKKNPLDALEKIETEKSKIFFMKDFSSFIEDLSIIRKIKNIHKILKYDNKYIFINNSEIRIPDELKEYITIIKFNLPNHQEIKLEISRIYKSLKIYNNTLIDSLTLLYQGFSINKIRKSIYQINRKKTLSQDIIYNVIKEKKEIIKQSNILELCNNDYQLEEIAGLNNLKLWLRIRKNVFSQTAYYYGISTPKGILLVGIQGTGKSLSATAISSEWKIPLVKLDISKIFTGILGESEKNIKKMIYVCERLSPCVLWIDEIDKIFSNNKYNYDGGTNNRINNIFLSWLSDRNTKIFIVATANNINSLPNEMLRKGRFDDIFFVDLPNFEERLHAFKIHLQKVRPFSWYKYNLHYLSQITENFSGAEIKQVINESMCNAFYENREFKTQDIIQSVFKTTPLYLVNERYHLRLQKLAKSGKIRNA